MELPSTVQAALADRPVAGATCLEAGAGAGNMTAALLAADAGKIVAVTDRAEHAAGVRERIDRDAPATIVTGDLSTAPLATDSVEIVTAHALFNVVPTAAIDDIVAELTRVAAPGAHLVVDDYEPIPAASVTRRLFAVENAAAELATGRPAQTFYAADHVRALFEDRGWVHDRTETLLDPVPWTAELLDAHVDVVREHARHLRDPLGSALVGEAEAVRSETESEEVGTFYSVAMRLPG